MGDMGEGWAEMKEAAKAKKARNRAWSTKYLTDQGFEFETRNNGAHLIVVLYSPITGKNEPAADFWPGTGKYKIRSAKQTPYKRGVRNLIADLERC